MTAARNSASGRPLSPPPRAESPVVDGRAVLWQLQSTRCAFRCELVAAGDGVELEVYRSGELRRRLRFLTDALARSRADRLRRRLEGRGFEPLLIEPIAAVP